MCLRGSQTSSLQAKVPFRHIHVLQSTAIDAPVGTAVPFVSTQSIKQEKSQVLSVSQTVRQSSRTFIADRKRVKTMVSHYKVNGALISKHFVIDAREAHWAILQLFGILVYKEEITFCELKQWKKRFLDSNIRWQGLFNNGATNLPFDHNRLRESRPVRRQRQSWSENNTNTPTLSYTDTT